MHKLRGFPYIDFDGRYEIHVQEVKKMQPGMIWTWKILFLLSRYFSRHTFEDDKTFGPAKTLQFKDLPPVNNAAVESSSYDCGVRAFAIGN